MKSFELKNETKFSLKSTLYGVLATLKNTLQIIVQENVLR